MFLTTAIRPKYAGTTERRFVNADFSFANHLPVFCRFEKRRLSAVAYFTARRHKKKRPYDGYKLPEHKDEKIISAVPP